MTASTSAEVGPLSVSVVPSPPAVGTRCLSCGDFCYITLLHIPIYQFLVYVIDKGEVGCFYPAFEERKIQQSELEIAS